MIDGLIEQVGEYFESIQDNRRTNASYELGDCLKSALAMFTLKDPSLAVFRENLEQRWDNLQRIFRLAAVPKDTALRAAIDKVAPRSFDGIFTQNIDYLRKEGIWQSRQVLDEYQAISIDGTEHYCSGKKSCPQCMVKNLKNGKQKFYHQMLGAVNMHPASKAVFPVGNEAIVRQDGATKNDCEQNAAKRLIPRLKEQYASDKLLFVLDGLYPTGPMIKLIKEDKAASFIIVIKDGYVLVQAERLAQQNKLKKYTWSDAQTKNVVHYANKLVLNGQNRAILVNYVSYQQIDIRTQKVLFSCSWITDIPIDNNNVKAIVKIGRSRWKIENETFNTLKNQGYHLEHNYGHGKEALATNFATLMFIAFLIDQMTQLLSANFMAAWNSCKSKKLLWEKVRQVFDMLPAASLNAIYKFVAKRKMLDYPLLE